MLEQVEDVNYHFAYIVRALPGRKRVLRLRSGREVRDRLVHGCSLICRDAGGIRGREELRPGAGERTGLGGDPVPPAGKHLVNRVLCIVLHVEDGLRHRAGFGRRLRLSARWLLACLVVAGAAAGKGHAGEYEDANGGDQSLRLRSPHVGRIL